MTMKTSNSIFKSAFRYFLILLAGLLAPQFLSAQAGWYNENWSFRREVTVPNPGATVLTEFQVKITLDNTFDFTKALANGSDVRVAASNGTTLIPFWIEDWNPAGTTASIWVKVPTIPTLGTVVYIYYGNPTPTAPPAGNPVETPPVGPFTRAAGNPITPSGAGGNVSLLAENIVYDPVTKHYWMCLANYSNSGIALCYSDTPTDPTSWIWHGNVVTTFSHFYSGAPHLVYHNGTWYLFYADRPNVMVATSSTVNGTYTINPTPVLQPIGTWDSYRVDEPYVFQRADGKWIMMYMAETGLTDEQVGYATADNVGGPYTPYSGNPVIRFGLPGSYDAGTVADPWVYEYHGTYYIGYTVSSTIYSPWQTALATTKDWVNFTKHGVILPAAGTSLDQQNSFRGALSRIGDEYVFSYTNGNYRMAIATQPVFSTPVSSETVSNPDAVFDFYDGFGGTSLDLTKWGITNGSASLVTLSGGYATLTSGSPFSRISGTSSFGMNYIGETRASHPTTAAPMVIGEVGFASSDFTTVRIVDNFKLGTQFWQRQAKIAPATDDQHIFYNMAQEADPNWHIFRVYRQSPNVAGFQIDDNPVETTTANVPTSSLPPFLMSYTEGVQSRLVVDWTRVRKWAGADPVTVVGSEQTESGLAEANYWTGAADIFWSNYLNWSENVVPDINTDVIIPNRDNDPLIASAAFCRSITINSGAILTIGASTAFTVSGNWENNGVFTPNGGSTVIFNGSTQSIGGTAYNPFQNLTLNSSESVTLNVESVVYGDLRVTGGVLDLGSNNLQTLDRSASGGKLTVVDGARLRIGGAKTLPANYLTHEIGSGSTVEYYGTNQVVAATSYGNLVLNGSLAGSSAKLFPAAGLTGIGSLSIRGTATATLPDGSVSSTGSLILGATAALSGSYGSTSSGATNPDNTYFTTGYTGTINHTVLTAGYWLGGASADWNNSANWVSGLPGSLTDVVIPNYAANQPSVNPDSPSALCRHLTVSPGASLTVKAGQALTVSGDLFNYGTLTIESSSVLANGSLIVAGGSSGNVTYNRVMNTSNNLYHYFSSPLGSTTFPTTGTVWEYKEPTGAWVTTVTNVPGRGYTLQKGITSLSFTGPVVTSDVQVEASSPYNDVITGGVAGEYIDRAFASGRDGTANWGGGGFNLLGNPYTSALNVAGFISGNITQFDPNYLALYLFNGSVYRYVSNQVGTWLNGTALNENYIQAGQGFFVLAMNDASVFTFTRSMQGHDTDVLLLKSAKTDSQWPGLQLKVSFGEKESTTLVVYNDNMTTGLDPGYDIGLMSSGQEVEIYTTLALADNGVNFTRQTLPVSGADKLKVSVGIDSEKGGEVTFSAVTVPIGTNRFWLEDKLTGIITEVGRNSYTVTLPENTFGTGRFYIIASTNTPTSVRKPVADDTDLRIWTSGGKIIIKGELGEKALCEMYDLNGKTILENRLNGSELNIINVPENTHGVFIVRVVDGIKVTSRKVVLP